MKSHAYHLTWTAAALTGFAIGRLLPTDGYGDRKDTPVDGKVTGMAGNHKPPGAGEGGKRAVVDGAAAGKETRTFPELVRNAFSDPLRERRLGKLHGLLDGATPGELAQMVQLIRENDLRGFGNGDEWSLVWSAWGQKGGADAMKAIQSQDWKDWDPAAPAEAQNRALAGWAAMDPQAAREWLETTEDHIFPGSPLSNSLLRGWCVSDPAGAATWLLKRGRGTPEEYRTVVEAMARKDGPGAAESWLATQGGSSEGLHGFVEAVNYSKRKLDPAAAAAWVEQHINEPWIKDSPVLQTTARSFAEKDPAAAMDWALRTGSGAAAVTVMRRWCETDSVAASEWLQRNRNSAAYTPAVVALVRSIRADNPAGARAWAETIPDTELRAQLLSSLPDAP